MQTSSPDSENSCYSEEHYISGDTGSSVVYAELASSRCHSQPFSELHHYSEIEDICRLSNIKRESSPGEDAYENLSFILPDLPSSTMPNDGSGYSANQSVPSSAYYSDISSCEFYALQRNQRNKRKRKRNSERSCPFVVSNAGSTDLPTLEARLHMSQHRCVQDTLQIINNTSPTLFPISYEGLNEYHTYLPCGQQITSCVNSCSNDVHLYRTSSNGSRGIEEHQRTAPSLPCRQWSVPQDKRHLKALLQAQHNMASVPSEYI